MHVVGGRCPIDNEVQDVKTELRLAEAIEALRGDLLQGRPALSRVSSRRGSR